MKVLRLLAVLVVCVFSVFRSAYAQGSNLVVNGDFSDGSLDWDPFDYIPPSFVAGGVLFDVGDYDISQYVVVSTGVEYFLSYDFSSSGDASGCMVGFDGGVGTIWYPIDVLQPISFVGLGDYTILKFRGLVSSIDHGCFIDNVVITSEMPATSTPASVSDSALGTPSFGSADFSGAWGVGAGLLGLIGSPLLIRYGLVVGRWAVSIVGSFLR